MSNVITPELLLEHHFIKNTVKGKVYYILNTDKYTIELYPKDDGSFICQVSDIIGYFYYATVNVKWVSKFNNLMDAMNTNVYLPEPNNFLRTYQQL